MGRQGPSRCPSLSPTSNGILSRFFPTHTRATSPQVPNAHLLLVRPGTNTTLNKHHGGDGRLAPSDGVRAHVDGRDDRPGNQQPSSFSEFLCSGNSYSWLDPSGIHISRILTGEALREAARADSAPRTPPPPGEASNLSTTLPRPEVSPALKAAIRYDVVHLSVQFLQ